MRINEYPARKPEWPELEKKEPTDESEINRMKLQIEKDTEEISDLAKEMVEMSLKGDKDLAGLKSAEIQQKQMNIQSLRLQMDKLKNPEKGSKAESVDNNSAASQVASDGGKEDKAGGSLSAVIEDRPAVIVELSQFAKNLLSTEN